MRAIACNACVDSPQSRGGMKVNLYRRHRYDCEGARPEDRGSASSTNGEGLGDGRFNSTVHWSHGLSAALADH